MSDTRSLDLGRLELHLADDGLLLHLSGEAEFTGLENNEDEGAGVAHLRDRLLDQHEARRPWVVKGHDYKVTIDLELAADLEPEGPEFAQVFAVKMKQSEA